MGQNDIFAQQGLEPITFTYAAIVEAYLLFLARLLVLLQEQVLRGDGFPPGHILIQ